MDVVPVEDVGRGRRNGWVCGERELVPVKDGDRPEPLCNGKGSVVVEYVYSPNVRVCLSTSEEISSDPGRSRDRKSVV